MILNKFKTWILFLHIFKTLYILIRADRPLLGHSDKPQKKMYLRSGPDEPPPVDEMTFPPTTKPQKGAPGAQDAANRFSTPPSTASVKNKRTTPARVSLAEQCDYLVKYCIRAYTTGKLCGRTVYYKYQDFESYCMLDYVNCMEKYEVWQVAHMGPCFIVYNLTEYVHYEYQDDFFLDQYYVLEDS